MILAILLGPPAFAWWVYARAEKARIRDQIVQVDRAILLAYLADATRQCHALAALVRSAQDLEKKRGLLDLSRKLRELHHVSVN